VSEASDMQSAVSYNWAYTCGVCMSVRVHDSCVWWKTHLRLCVVFCCTQQQWICRHDIWGETSFQGHPHASCQPPHQSDNMWVASGWVARVGIECCRSKRCCASRVVCWFQWAETTAAFNSTMCHNQRGLELTVHRMCLCLGGGCQQPKPRQVHTGIRLYVQECARDSNEQQ
jgi:hypothetical protein